MEVKDDPAIAAIREVRHEISEEFNYDLSKLFEYYVELQKQYEQRLLNTNAEPLPSQKSRNQPDLPLSFVLRR
ncbi:MAG: hypothetical protein M3X11_13765 [Acidobacteriota bacterium]|nr:hypothetical protein [Acidobacteriota bacterium]